MEQVFPVLPGVDDAHIVIKGNGQEIKDLIVLPLNDDRGTIVSRWKFTWRERFRLFWTGQIFLSQLTFYDDIQPVRLDSESPIPPTIGAAHLIARND